MRVADKVERGAPLTLTVDGRPVTAFEGETLATALLAAGIDGFRCDLEGRPRGPFCNMGVCYECLLEVAEGGGPAVRLRGCITPARAGQAIRTGLADDR
ncbi:MAG: (2Fe-2S)-binding protein [Caulobacteraceae bacterium]